MVLADLGRKLNAALSSLNRAPIVDEKVHVPQLSKSGASGINTGRSPGSRCDTQGDHRGAPRVRRQREAGVLAAPEDQGKSQGISRKQCIRQNKRGEQEESRAKG